MILDTKLTDIAIKNNILKMFDCYELETQRQFTSLVSKGSNPNGEWARKIFKIRFNNKMGWAKLSLLYIEMLQLSDYPGQYSRLVGGRIFSFID